MLSGTRRKVVGSRYIDESMTKVEQERRKNFNLHIETILKANECNFDTLLNLLKSLPTLETDDGILGYFHKNSETIGMPCTHSGISLFHSILKRNIFSGNQKAKLIEMIEKKGYGKYFHELLTPELATILFKEAPSLIANIYLKLLKKGVAYSIETDVEIGIWDLLFKNKMIQEKYLRDFFECHTHLSSHQKILDAVSFSLSKLQVISDATLFFKGIEHSISNTKLREEIDGLVKARISALKKLESSVDITEVKPLSKINTDRMINYFSSRKIHSTDNVVQLYEKHEEKIKM